MLRRRIRNTNGVRPDEKGRIRQEKPISHSRSPPQGFARSSRFAGLSRAACAPLPRRPLCEDGGSFRNNPVPEDEPMRNFRSNPAQRRDHYQELTDKIIAALGAGTAPWRRPWDKAACGGATAPVNAATGHRYRGINLFVLGMSPLAFASNDSRWCSYRQAAARGWQVRKGEKATPVYFYKPIEIEDKTNDGERETRRIPILRTFSVFHASQIDGIPALAPAVATKAVAERIEDVEIIVQESGVPVRIGGDRAFYSPSFDFVSRFLRTKLFTARNCAQQRNCMNCHMRAVTLAD